MTLASVSILWGTTHTDQARVAVYQGGTLTTGPHDSGGATLIEDLGATSGSTTSDWVTVTSAGAGLAASTTTWICIKSDAGASFMRGSAGDTRPSGNFQVANGRWSESGVVNSDDTVAWPSSWPTGDSGSFATTYGSFKLAYSTGATTDRLDLYSESQGSGDPSISYAVSAGSNRLLVAAVTWDGNTSAVDSWDYGGQTMVEVVEEHSSPSGTNAGCSIAYILDAGISAASGTTISANLTPNPSRWQIAVASYKGVNQSGGAGTVVASNTASSPSSTPNPLIVDLTESAGGIVVAALGIDNTGHGWFNTAIFEKSDLNSSAATGVFADRISTTSSNVDIEATSETQNYAGACSVAFAGIAAAAVTPALTLLGVGR